MTFNWKEKRKGKKKDLLSLHHAHTFEGGELPLFLWHMLVIIYCDGDDDYDECTE